jgi:hypothetical protein
VSFLSPWFIAGLLAVTLPIVFHMIRRTPHGRMPFSTLMFLNPSPPRMTRRSRLDNWLLLLLRALALCLLALAFARPFFRTEAAAEFAAGEGRRIAVLIDTSAGMHRGTLWPDALARARQVIGEVRPDDRLGVFTFDRRTRTVIDFDEWSQLEHATRRDLAQQRLKELQPSWAGTDLGQALIAATEALASTDRQDQPGQVLGPKQIVVVSDLKLGSKLSALQAGPWPQDVQVQIERLPVAKPTNAGVQLVADGQSVLSDEDRNRPRVRVSNAADSTRERFRLVWDGYEHVDDHSLEIYVPPGNSRVIRAPTMPPSAKQARLVLKGDDHDFDNTIHVERTEAQTLTVAYYGAEPADDPQGLRYYFERAFPETPGRRVEVAEQDPAAPPLPVDDLDVRLAVVTTELPEPHARHLRQYVQSGGTLIHVLRTADDCQTLAALLDIDAEDLAAGEANVDGYAMLTQVDFGHPLFAPFADARFSDFTKIRIWKHRSLRLDALPDSRVLAQFDNGDPALVEFPVERGRILLFTSGWQPVDSQWALSSKFVPLLNGILETSGAQVIQGARYVIGDAVPLGLSSSAGESPPTVRLPDGNEIALAPDQTSFTKTTLPGVYSVETAQGPMKFIIDLDADESKTSPLPLERLEALGVRLAASESTAAAAARQEQQRQLQARELESRQKNWRWLILAALAVLLLETCLAGRFSRKLMTQGTQEEGV